jgi:hypothetical protein
MVDRLGTLVAPSGKILFSSEPIDYKQPYPWGLRLDGQSVWAIRRNGWLELGFNIRYFRALMAQRGWRLEHRALPGCGMAQVIVATRGHSPHST